MEQTTLADVLSVCGADAHAKAPASLTPVDPAPFIPSGGHPIIGGKIDQLSAEEVYEYALRHGEAKYRGERPLLAREGRVQRGAARVSVCVCCGILARGLTDSSRLLSQHSEPCSAVSFVSFAAG